MESERVTMNQELKDVKAKLADFESRHREPVNSFPLPHQQVAFPPPAKQPSLAKLFSNMDFEFEFWRLFRTSDQENNILNLKVSLSTFSVSACKVQKINNVRLNFCNFVKISDSKSEFKASGFYTELEEESDCGIFVKSEQSDGEVMRVFDVGDEDEFFKGVVALAKSHSVYCIFKNGTVHRCNIDLTVEQSKKK